MFNNADIKNDLFGLVGWDDLNPPVNLSAENKVSRSGRFYQNFHSICTLSNIYALMEKENASEQEFNDFLVKLQVSAILNSLHGVFNEDSLIEQVFLFNRRDDRATSIDLTGKKVGYRIFPVKDSSYCTVIKSISLLFAQGGTVNVQLWHSNTGHLWDLDCEVEAGVEKIFNVDTAIYYSCNKYKGGFFYLWYEYGLPPVEYALPDYNKTLMFRAEPFEGELDETASICTGKTYGMNVEFCSYRDFTEIIRMNKQMFSTLIGMQMAACIVEMTLNSARSNKTERITKEQQARLFNDLNTAYSSPEFPYTTGLKNQIAREIKRIKGNYLPKQKLTISTPCFT
jgi:hypothetical protein